MLATSVLAAVVGVALCIAIVNGVARRFGLPIRETLMWFGLVEPDAPTLERACARLELAEARLKEAGARRSRDWQRARTDNREFAGP